MYRPEPCWLNDAPPEAREAVARALREAIYSIQPLVVAVDVEHAEIGGERWHRFWGLRDAQNQIEEYARIMHRIDIDPWKPEEDAGKERAGRDWAASPRDSAAMLRRLEWSADGGGRCPCCGSSRLQGHRGHCEVFALLARVGA